MNSHNEYQSKGVDFMSFLKEAGDSLLKYTEKIVSKTEEYAKIGKITLDIKRLESGIEKTHRELGEFVIMKMSQGENSISLTDRYIIERSEMINEYRAAIEAKRKDIEEIKRAGSSSRTDPSVNISNDSM